VGSLRSKPTPSPPVEEKAASPAANGDARTSGTEQATASSGEAVDEDAEAAAYLSDEPKKVEVPTSIKFICEFCDHPMELGMDMAGKRTPCPECRRIIKVPDLAKPVKKDWLKSAQPEAAPEGATGTGKGATMVSEEALEAAGAIPDDPLTRGQKVFRGVGVACAVLLL